LSDSLENYSGRTVDDLIIKYILLEAKQRKFPAVFIIAGVCRYCS